MEAILRRKGTKFIQKAYRLEKKGKLDAANSIYERALIVLTKSYELVPKRSVAIKIGALLNVFARYKEAVALFLSLDTEGLGKTDMKSFTLANRTTITSPTEHVYF